MQVGASIGTGAEDWTTAETPKIHEQASVEFSKYLTYSTFDFWTICIQVVAASHTGLADGISTKTSETNEHTRFQVQHNS